MVILKVKKSQGYILLLENTISEKPQWGQIELILLQSAKLHTSDFETRRRISVMKMFNNKGRRFDPCNIPKITIRQLLRLELFLSFFFS